MTSRWHRQGLGQITAMVLLCSACGGEAGSTSVNGGTGGAGATTSGGAGGTTSGGMGATGTTTGGQPASGAGGTGGPSAGGSSASGSSNLGGSGGVSTVTGAGGVTWSGYCVATFTSDYDVLDSFDEPLFTARVPKVQRSAYPPSSPT